MKNWRSLLIPCLSSAFIIGVSNPANSQHELRSSASFTRQVTFELTFANRDLIWLGDPASPTASVYPKPNARPIATDLCVNTLIKDNVSSSRRYFHEARIATENGLRNVYAFTSRREKHIGIIDHKGHLSPNEFYKNNRELLPSWPADGSSLTYDDQRNMLYCGIDISGPLVSESLDFLPLKLSSANGQVVDGRYSIAFAPSDNSGHGEDFGIASLTVRRGQESVILANATVPTVFRGTNVQLGSFDNESGTNLTEAAYRAGATNDGKTEPSVTVTIPGKFSSSIRIDTASLVLVDIGGDVSAFDGAKSQVSRDRIAIDGDFDDWRNIAGVDDPRGDLVPYLEYIPDVDLLEFKVSHDNQNIYLYARVAGKVGRSHPRGGRAYFYAYMDVDRDSGTGFLPTRDDDCYFGVDIGDDCEVQFEFVNNALRKTFYGFCGIGGNANVLKQQVSVGKSQYGRFDTQGVERANYKSEYIYRNKVTEITEDLKLGTSDTIHLAVSPDGSEVEVSSTFTGFLKNPSGQPTVQLGQTIDLAVGMECDSKAYLGKTAWGADSTRAIRGYELVPAGDTERVRARRNKKVLQ